MAFWWSHREFSAPSLTPGGLTCSCTVTWHRGKCGSSRRHRVCWSCALGERLAAGWKTWPPSSTAWPNGCGTRIAWPPRWTAARRHTTGKGPSFKNFVYKKVVCIVHYCLGLGWKTSVQYCFWNLSNPCHDWFDYLTSNCKGSWASTKEKGFKKFISSNTIPTIMYNQCILITSFPF